MFWVWVENARGWASGFHRPLCDDLGRMHITIPLVIGWPSVLFHTPLEHHSADVVVGFFEAALAIHAASFFHAVLNLVSEFCQPRFRFSSRTVFLAQVFLHVCMIWLSF